MHPEYDYTDDGLDPRNSHNSDDDDEIPYVPPTDRLNVDERHERKGYDTYSDIGGYGSNINKSEENNISDCDDDGSISRDE